MLGSQHMPRVMEIIGTPADVNIGSGHKNTVFYAVDGASMKMKLHIVTEVFFARAFHFFLV